MPDQWRCGEAQPGQKLLPLRKNAASRAACDPPRRLLQGHHDLCCGHHGTNFKRFERSGTAVEGEGHGSSGNLSQANPGGNCTAECPNTSRDLVVRLMVGSLPVTTPHLAESAES